MYSLRRTLAVRYSLTMFLALLGIALWALGGTTRLLRAELERGISAATQIEAAVLATGRPLASETGIGDVARFVERLNRFIVARDTTGRIVSANTPLAASLHLDSAAFRRAREGASAWADIAWEGHTLRAHFIPTLPLGDLPNFTASADIGLQPLRNTCFNHFTTDSNKLFEYCMAGLPVAASNFPEIRRIVIGHGIGVVFDPADPDSVRTQLSRLIDDRELRQSMADRARNARRQLSWESQEETLRALYRGLRPEAPVPGK